MPYPMRWRVHEWRDGASKALKWRPECCLKIFMFWLFQKMRLDGVWSCRPKQNQALLSSCMTPETRRVGAGWWKLCFVSNHHSKIMRYIRMGLFASNTCLVRHVVRVVHHTFMLLSSQNNPWCLTIWNSARHSTFHQCFNRTYNTSLESINHSWIALRMLWASFALLPVCRTLETVTSQWE